MFRHLRPVALLRVFLGIALPLLVVGLIAEDLVEHQRFLFEKPLMLALHAHATPLLNHLAVALQTLGGVMVIAPVSALILLGLWFRRRAAALFFTVSLVGTALLNGVMKLAFHRPRPMLWPWLVHESGASFPSGHSMYSMALAVTLTLLLWHTPWRWLALVCGLAFSLIVGVSRVYLGVHYPTDVLAGWLAGLAWVFGVYTVLVRRTANQ